MIDLMLLAESLEYSWTAEVLLHNGFIIRIWYTAFPSMKNHMIKEIVSISSDLPKHFICKTFIIQ